MSAKLLECFLFATFFPFSLLASGNDKVMKYYQEINEAEYAFTQNQVRQSTQHYKNAFQLYPTGYAKDYINGAIIGVVAGDLGLAEEWISEAIRRGMSQGELINHRFLSKKLGKNYLSKIYTATVSSKKLLYKPEVHRTIDSLFVLDQYVRNGYDKGTVDKIKWRYTDSLITNELKNIIRIHGHLGESVVGYPGTINKVALMITHNVGRFDLEIFKEFVFDGTMLPAAYARAKDLDFLVKKNERYYYYIIYDAVSPDNKSYVQYSSVAKADIYDVSKLPEINVKREEIGLQSVERMRLFFQKKYRKYRFVIQTFA